MTARPPQDAPAAPAALTAFLRGVERRGAVFAQLLAGDGTEGDAALSIAMHAFRGMAARSPFADWPRRFWSQLLAAPTLRQPPRSPAWAAEFAWLGQLGHGPRAALLLRLVAGLSEADAAAVLGIARPTYRLALQRALPHHADGSPDVEAWRALGDATQAVVRGLPAERLAHLAHEREDAIHPGQRRRPPAPAVGDAPPRWWRPALAGVAVATALALAATVWPGVGDLGGTAPDGIRSEPLPPAEEPAARYPPEAALASHRDLDLLLAAGQLEAAGAAAADPAFHAWYAAQLAAEGKGEGAGAQPPAANGDAPAADSTRSETDDAP